MSSTKPDLILPETEKALEVHIWMDPPKWVVIERPTDDFTRLFTYSHTFRGMTPLQYIEQTAASHDLPRAKVATDFLLEKFLLER